MPSGKMNVSGSLKGAVVNQPRSFSQMSGRFRHSSIVVQIENDGAKSYDQPAQRLAVRGVHLRGAEARIVGAIDDLSSAVPVVVGNNHGLEERAHRRRHPRRRRESAFRALLQTPPSIPASAPQAAEVDQARAIAFQ